MEELSVSHTPWKIGLEVELLAPKGSSRQTLAARIAGHASGRVLSRVFHHESEPSKVVGQPVFENLTLGFEVRDARGSLIARCVDDLTLQADLERTHPPQPGWFRVVSDDARILRLAARHADLTQDLHGALSPVAELFGSALESGEGGMWRLSDVSGASILIGAPLPGERERPCELITAPLIGERALVIGELLDHARALDFTIPQEGALHVHFDAAPLKSASAIKLLIGFFYEWGETLRWLVKTNPRCTRLGGWDDALVSAVYMPGFERLSWEETRAKLLELPLTKFCDYNLSNLARGLPHKDTFEVRTLPSTLDPDEVISAVELYEGILRSFAEDHALKSAPPESLEALKPSVIQLLEELREFKLLSSERTSDWIERVHTDLSAP